ncbi:AAA family ATPase [Micromonospora aurantiaca (nom. illeg.)]|uniref:AAA family ATPase n=1 Tax=Micromonospora aurantiaca (nom. illeg.) TaxID=47850 RepID=UPI000827C44A|nr:AAA family ATPase [Micromonospora aurantiaca]SCL36056.1 Helix-turn-helix domain-containing protein [Micromonospora aurantiaca]
MSDAQRMRDAKKTLGRQLATWRTRRGLRQHDLADEIPMSRSTIAGVEAGAQVVDETFWSRCDSLLRADGELLATYRQYRALERRYQQERAEAARRKRWGPVTAVARTSDMRDHETAVAAPGIEADEQAAGPSPVSVMQEVLKSAATGAGGSDPAGVDLSLLEQRVLDAHDARWRRGPREAPLLVVVGGYAGSGKTQLGELLAALTGWPLLDKDTLTRPMTEELLRALGGDPNDRHSDAYLAAVRPIEYRCLLNAAFDQLRHGTSTIVTAPLLREAPDPRWLDRMRSRFTASQISIATIWVDADIESMYRRLASRDAARDSWKLNHWDAYSGAIDLDLRPAWNHLVIDNGTGAVRPIEQQAALVGRIISPA